LRAWAPGTTGHTGFARPAHSDKRKEFVKANAVEVLDTLADVMFLDREHERGGKDNPNAVGSRHQERSAARLKAAT
jgi:hypothetical protein